MTALDVATIKRDFPILERKVNGKRLVYLDSASSAQKPLAVLDAMDDSYRRHYANIHLNRAPATQPLKFLLL